MDAHSLWHAATVPLTVLFYYFIGLDMTWWYALKKVRVSIFLSLKSFVLVIDMQRLDPVLQLAISAPPSLYTRC